MKKSTAAVIGCVLGSLLATNAAFARNTVLCSIPKNLLQKHGFTQGSVYDAQQIKAFYDVVNVSPEDTSALKPGVMYKLTYHCTLDKVDPKNVAYASLRAVETPVPQGMLTSNSITVSWKFTKPFGF